MKVMGISKFKTNALKILDQVSKTHEVIVITRRGKPLAQIIPYRTNDKHPMPGTLSETLVFEGDIISPLDENMWDACR